MAALTHTSPGDAPAVLTSARPSRRNLLATAGLAAAAIAGFAEADAAPLHLVAVPDRDAELIALVDRLTENQARFVALTEPYYNVAGSRPADVDAKIQRNVQNGHQISDEISDTPAHTLEGYRAKARAYLTKIDRDWDGELDPDPEQYIAVSLCQDLLAGAAS